MGTTFNKGDKPKNRITISKSGDVVARNIDPDTGKVDRSFAQPNPALPERNVEPKAHANEQEESDALNKNSVKGRQYTKKENDEG